ncbi:MAG: GatB/YqeY domain-containing protein [Paludibacteraceae bacterium]|nr:GatB/YqeY domain-containing protein [Paludibacteraceae bacterium]
MELIDQITEDIKKAMFAKQKTELDALRGIKKELLEAKTAKGGDGTISEDISSRILQKMVKQRKESAQIYVEQNRAELAEKELEESEIIARYLPKQLSDEELTAIIQSIITQVGATSAKDMGKVMGVATKQLTGKVEGKLISEKVKSLLNE